MIALNDIYFKVDSSIVSRDFWKVSMDEKKQLIDDELKKYIISKIVELDTVKMLSDDAENTLSVNDLLNTLANKIPKEQHFETLRHFTHYILQVAGSLQSWYITWFCEDNPELIETPLTRFNDDGLWDDLKTHVDTDYVKAFNFVYDVFNNSFMKEEKQKVIE